jgi:hypothetical protein
MIRYSLWAFLLAVVPPVLLSSKKQASSVQRAISIERQPALTHNEQTKEFVNAWF